MVILWASANVGLAARWAVNEQGNCVQEWTPSGARAFTQDLWFFEQAGAVGLKFACDTRVKVGHYDMMGIAGQEDMVW